MNLCPHCGARLEGLGLYCWGCRRYVDDGERADTSREPSDALPDTRSEDERKRDARPAVEALGWTVVDVPADERFKETWGADTMYVLAWQAKGEGEK